MANKCLIYCRVSSDRQVKEGHGLDSQEKRCRDYAKSRNYEVEKVFREEGIMGELFDRPAMKELVNYLDKKVNNNYVIVFDDLKRFSRDVIIHFRLKSEIYGRGSTIESPNFRFEDSPEGKFVETVIVATGELEKNQNKRQVKQKMKARLEMGYWPFGPPPGLINKSHPLHKKILVNNEPIAGVYKQAIESYDRGLFNTLEEVRQFLETEYKKYAINSKTSISGTKAVLSKLLYTGYLEYLPWGITRRKAQHEGFIDIAVFDRVQEKLKGKAKFAARKDYNLDFPLRPVVLCDACGHPLTGAWVHGRSEKYPKYWCKNKRCLLYSKSIRRKDIHTQFETLLKSSKPGDEVVELMKKVFFEAWSDKAGNFKATQAQTIREIDSIDKEISDLSGQLAKKLAANDQVMVKIYENQIKKVSEEANRLKGDLGEPRYTFDQLRTAKDKVFDTLKEPVLMWKSDEYKDKLTIFAMYFDAKLRYDMKEGFRTAILALPIALMKQSETEKNSLVEMPGVEPGSKETPLKKFSER